MSTNYVTWHWSASVRYGAVLRDLIHFEKPYLLRKGIPLAQLNLNKIQFAMHPDHVRNTIPTDHLSNINATLVISERLKDFLEKRRVESVEYLPVTILDHKRKPIREEYFIANTYNSVDCLDLKASKPTYSKINKNNITDIKSLVLDPAKIDPQRELFRVLNFGNITIASRKLADAIDTAGFSSIEWHELADYDGDA